MPGMQSLLRAMVDKGASDLFVTCGAPPHLKIDGTTRPIKAPAIQPGEGERLARSLMTDRQAADFDATLESNLGLRFEGLGRFRVNAYYQRGEVALVIRLIPSAIPSFADLGLPEYCARLAMLKRGLVLFVGAAGSGKSTSLAALIQHRARHADGHILTIEDPIEFEFSHDRSLVDQREVSIDTHSFGDALRNAMREAPDVIMIGEIRDLESARHAIAYAETGHLCLSTLHANNAQQAIDRLINFFPEQAQKQLFMDLSLNLKGVVSQRLVPSVDKSRVLATEMLLLTPYVSELIREGRVDEVREIMVKSGRPGGMHTFDQSLYQLYQQQRISRETALHYADSINDLSLRITMTRDEPDKDIDDLHIDELEPHHYNQVRDR